MASRLDGLSARIKTALQSADSSGRKTAAGATAKPQDNKSKRNHTERQKAPHTSSHDGKQKHGPAKRAGPPAVQKKMRNQDTRTSPSSRRDSDAFRKHSSEGPRRKTNPQSTNPQSSSAKNRNKRDDFLNEIRALGGDETDLALIGDQSDSDTAASEVEYGDDAIRVGSKLQDSIQKIMSGTNVEDDDDDDDNDHDDEEEAKKVGKTAKDHQSQGQGSGDEFLEWYNIPLEKTPRRTSNSLETVAALQDRGEKILEKASVDYYLRKPASEREFSQQLMRSGTLSDRLSTLTLRAQESPMHNRKALESLLQLAERKSRTEAVQAIGALKDLFLSSLLPERKLGTFEQLAEGVDPRSVRDQHLMTWVFEAWLKKFYFRFVHIMERLARDPLPFPRNHMITYIFELLTSKPEQEANLLRLLVDKLGDLDRKLASKTSHFILQLELAHPMMKSIITEEIYRAIMRSRSQNPHIEYFAILTLSQTIFTKKDVELSNRFIEIYFSLFEHLLRSKDKDVDEKADADPGKEAEPGKGQGPASKKKGGNKNQAKQTGDHEEAQYSKTFSALLTGINRAAPYSSLSREEFDKHMLVLYRIVHGLNFNASIQALMLIQKLSSSADAVDRYMRVLYELLLDFRLVTSSKQSLFLNLLYKALRNDSSNDRIRAFVKRLLQSFDLHEPPYICGVLYMLITLRKDKPDALEGLGRSENDDGNAEEYDGRKRDPQFAAATSASLWELSSCKHHYHPTVCLYAAILADPSMEKTSGITKPELAFFSLSNFLDKFVYRSPRQKPVSKGGSLMQPAAASNRPGNEALLLRGQNSAQQRRPASSSEFWSRPQTEISVDERFFHRFFQDRKRTKQLHARIKPEESHEQDSDVSSTDYQDVLGADVDGDDVALDGMASDDDDDDDEEDEALDEMTEFSVDEEHASAGSDEESELDESALLRAFNDDGNELSDDESDGGDIDFWQDSDDDADAKRKSPKDTGSSSKKRKASSKSKDAREQRKRLKDLPIFAAAEDYAEHLRD